MICRNCGNSNVENSRFCEKCGTELIGEIPLKQLQVDARKSFNPNKKNNSKIIISIIVVIIAIGGLFIGYKDYRSKNVSKKVIKNDLMGYEFEYGDMEIKINSDNLKAINIQKKEVTMEDGIRFYEAEGTVVLESKKYKLELPMEVLYAYDRRNGTWMSWSGSIDDDSEYAKLEIKEELTEDIIKRAFIGNEINSVPVIADIANSLVIDSIEEDDYGTSVIAYSTLENKGEFVTKKSILKAKIYFNGEEWVIYENSIRSIEENVVVTQPSADLTIEKIKQDLLMLIEDEKFSGYEGYKSIEISLDDINSIENLEVDSIKGSTYIITANVAGENDGLVFDGDIEIEVSEYGYVDCEIEFNNLSLENPTEDQLKELVVGEELTVWIDKKSNYHLITDKDKETLKINEILDDKNDPFIKHVYVNMTYTEQGKIITSDLIYIKINYYDSESGWEISKMVSATDTSFARYYGKDVINRSNKY